MADEPGFEVARAYVSVSPDAAGFEEELRGEVEHTGITVLVPVRPNATGLREEVQAEADSSGAEIRVPVTAETAGLREEVQAAADSTGASITVPVHLQPGALDAEADAEGDAAGAIAGASFADKFSAVASSMQLFPAAKTDAEASAAGTEAGALFSEQFRAAASQVDFDARLNPASAEAAIAEARAMFDAAGVTMPVHVNIAGSGAAALDAILAELRAQTSALTDQTTILDGAMTALGVIQRDTADSSADLMMQTEALRGGFAGLDGQLDSVIAHLGALDAAASASAGGGLGALGSAMNQASGSARSYGGWLGLLTKEVTLFGGALGDNGIVGRVQLWHIALDGLLETTIAVTAAAAALTAGLIAMAPAAEDIYTHLKSVSSVSNALGVTIPPLTGHFQALSQSLAPQVLEAFGGALNAVSNSTGVFGRVATEVATGIDDIVAKIDLWAAGQQHMGGILQSGVGFLHQFTSIAGSLGVAIDNLIKADPGTAHFLGDLVEGAAKAVEIFTSLPSPVLEAALAIHGFILWGGLLATGLSKLLTPIRAVTTAMGALGDATATAALEDEASGLDRLKATFTDIAAGLSAYGSNIVKAASESEGFAKVTGTLDAASAGLLSRLAALAASPWTWVAVAAAAFGYLAYQSLQASNSVKGFIAQVNQNLASGSASQAILGIAAAIGQMNDKIRETNISSELQGMGLWQKTADQLRVSVTDLARGMSSLGSGTSAVKELWAGVSSLWNAGGAAALQASKDTAAYRGAIVSLTGEQSNLFGETGKLIQQGYTYNQALALMDLAGVKAGDSFAVMQQKVANLIAGYQAMSVQGGLLANGVNAVTFASEQQQSKVAALTQGWQAFLSMVTGGESSFTTFEQQLTGISAAASTAANTLTVSNGKVGVSTKAAGNAAAQASVQIDGLSSASLQLRSSFGTAITDAGQLMTSLTQMASAAGLGAKGTQMLAQAGKDMVAQLLPMAKGSQEATAQLYALAQLAGYQGTDSFKSLAQWVGKTHDAEGNLNSITAKLTAASANLAADVENLANAIGQNLNQAMAAAILQATGGQKVFNDFANAVSNNKDNISADQTAAQKLASQLITLTGNTTAAKGEFVTFSEKLGLTQQQADQLWASVVKGAGDMSSTHSARQEMIDDLEKAGQNAQTAQSNVGKLTAAIVKDGSSSSAGASARQQLIKDLENAGLSAKQAAALVNQYVTALKAIPARINTTLSINEITIPGTHVGHLSSQGGNARGGLIKGGTPGKDSVLSLLTPGEVVVPAPMVRAGAVDHLRGRLPGFAGGGSVSSGGGATPTAEVVLARWSFSGAGGGSSAAPASAAAQLAAWTPAYAASSPGGIGGYATPGLMTTPGGQVVHSATSNAGGVVVNFNGVAFPNPEQVHAMQMALATAVGGAG